MKLQAKKKKTTVLIIGKVNLKQLISKDKYYLTN